MARPAIDTARTIVLVTWASGTPPSMSPDRDPTGSDLRRLAYANALMEQAATQLVGVPVEQGEEPPEADAPAVTAGMVTTSTRR